MFTLCNKFYLFYKLSFVYFEVEVVSLARARLIHPISDDDRDEEEISVSYKALVYMIILKL